ncbi:hypothetical protein TeGR_g2744 [Tetraparma gracilis]|uniref:Uncharacterized protein n=1 Tax=Tetraparma gracilis TaxID=2962635 RepID=A0ABQ6MD35_9STRA|nr:hypothetical protein TeGR_g2744 [Tetraparma gracilis]
MASTLRQACAGFRSGLDVPGSTSMLEQLRAAPSSLQIYAGCLCPSAGDSLRSGEDLEAFHALSGLQHVLLRRWDAIPSETRRHLRDWLLHLGLEGGPPGVAFQAPTQNAALAAAAAAWKRGWVEELERERGGNPNGGPEDAPNPYDPRAPSLPGPDSLIASLKALSHPTAFSSPDPAPAGRLIRANVFLASLVGEMSGGGRNKVNLGQTILFHKRAHEEFEAK